MCGLIKLKVGTGLKVHMKPSGARTVTVVRRRYTNEYVTTVLLAVGVSVLPKFISWEERPAEIHCKVMILCVCVCVCVLAWGLENMVLCSAEIRSCGTTTYTRYSIICDTVVLLKMPQSRFYSCPISWVW